MARIAVVGAAKGSLGFRVAQLARERGHTVLTVGLSGDVDLVDDARLTNPVTKVHDWMGDEYGCNFDHVVCTVGANDPSLSLANYFDINVGAPVALCRSYLDLGGTGHFVAISSNSAQIARTGSLGYCASKAALTMAIRCMARDNARLYTERINEDLMPAIYVYEPGWLGGTPMSNDVEARLPQGAPLHRIPNGRHLSPYDLATAIVSNLYVANSVMNGAVLRLDGGEQ